MKILAGCLVVGLVLGSVALVRDALRGDIHHLIEANQKLVDANKRLMVANSGLLDVTKRVEEDAEWSVRHATVETCTIWMNASSGPTTFNERYSIQTGDWNVSKLDNKTWTFMRVR